jgi:hypothetical protein
MKKAELNLRHRLRDAMNGSWLLTWHEDRHINPGVPDLSFVMKKGNCETGWIELKAEREYDSKGKVNFCVEPSQIDWIERHRERVPIFFMVAVGEDWFLLSGIWSKHLQNVTRDDLYQGAIAHGTLDTLRDVTAPLIARTTRK